MADQSKPWIESRLPVREALRTHLTDVKLPRDMPYLAALGGLITGTLILLALSGLVLGVYYNPWQGFESIQNITREVNYGWLIQGFHETGTTMLFGAVYLMLFRGILGREYRAPGEIVWFLKLKLFVVLLLVGYLGYTLSDGAESHWSLSGAALGAARMGGVAGAVGNWFFGGPLETSTLARMATLHVSLALLLFLLLAAHLAAKRAVAKTPARPVSLHPYYTSQYFVAFVVFALIFAILLFFAPQLGESRLNLLPASGLVVPASVVLPWYLLPAAGIADAASGSMGHIIAFIAGIAALAALPWLDRSKPGSVPKFRSRALTFLLGVDVIALSLTETAAPTTLTSLLGMLFTAWYFLHFLVLTPLVTATEPA